MRSLHSLAAQQDGVVTRKQMLASGMTSNGVDRWIAGEKCRRLHGGVYLLSGHPMTSAVRLRAAVAVAGEGAVAFGPSAAWWSGMLDNAPSGIFITVPTSRRPRRSTWTVRRRNLHREDMRTHRSMRITGTDLTVLETAELLARFSFGDGMSFLDRALQTSTTLERLHEAHERNLGRTGSARAAAMLKLAAAGGESQAERVFVGMLRSSSLTGWVCGHRSCGYLIDVAFPEQRVAIEIDGWAYHRDAQRMANDAIRQNRLVAEGWTVLRFTYHRLIAEPEVVMAEVRSVLGA